MKTKNKFLIPLVIIMFVITGLTVYKPTQQKKKLIIGTWVCKSTPEWSIEFTDKGKCYWYYKGDDTEIYNYTILKEKSQNGKLTFYTLKLVNIKDAKDFYQYDIVGLGKTMMTLDYLGDMGTKLTYFEKQK